MVSVSFLVGYPKWKVRCSTAVVSLSEDTKVEIDQRGSWNIQKGGKGNTGTVYDKLASLTWTCKQANNFAPNKYRGVVNSSGLVVYKGSNARDKKGY